MLNDDNKATLLEENNTTLSCIYNAFYLDTIIGCILTSTVILTFIGIMYVYIT